jgi:hypothetical protein
MAKPRSHNDIYIAFIPWVLFSVISRRDTVEAAALIALVASIAIAIPGLRNGRPKLLELGAIVAFAAFSIVAVLADPSAGDWLERYGRAIAAALLAAIAFGSVALGMPFTEQYARETVPEQFWHTARFRSINRQISLLWGAVFALFVPSHIIAGYLDTRHANTIFNWVVPIALVVFAIKRTGQMADKARPTD